MMCMDLVSITVLNIHSADYCCTINGISKSEDVNLLKKANLKEKRGTL